MFAHMFVQLILFKLERITGWRREDKDGGGKRESLEESFQHIEL